MKRFILGFLLGTLILGTPSLAQNTVIRAFLSDVRIQLDGKPLALKDPPIIYNDRTYLPVRGIAEAVGKEVGYDEGSRTVIISDEPYIPFEETVMTFVTPESTYAAKIGKYNDILYIRATDVSMIANGYGYRIDSHEGDTLENPRFCLAHRGDIIINDLPIEFMGAHKWDFWMRYDYFENTIMPILKGAEN